MTGYITDIKRFAVHDGDGIRTTVFLKGCPLRCVWCHNPEGLSRSFEIAYFNHKCVGCGRCADICEANIFRDGEHIFDREKCTRCGKCAEICDSGAFKAHGREIESDELVDILLLDKIFYESSGGGITISGGECLLQADFCREVLKKCREAGIHTAIDTSGYVSREALDKVIPFTDIFLYDIKAISDDVHKRCTGVSSRIILENLKYLDSLGCKTEIRVPYVPGHNDTEMKKIGKFLGELRHVTKVRVLPYHNYAASKYDSLGIENTLPERLPTEEEIENAKFEIRNAECEVRGTN